MSVEHFLSQSLETPRIREILRGPEFQEGHSRMKALADSLSNEGHRGIVGVYGEVKQSGRHITNVPSGLTADQANRVQDNGAGVLWGAMFTTFERLMKEGKYDPKQFVQLVINGFVGTKWGDSLVPASKEELSFNPASLMPLARLATQDKTLSFLATDRGLSMLPVAFRAEIVGTRYSERLRGEFAQSYKPMAEAILALPKTPDENTALERRNAREIKPLSFS